MVFLEDQGFIFGWGQLRDMYFFLEIGLGFIEEVCQEMLF